MSFDFSILTAYWPLFARGLFITIAASGLVRRLTEEVPNASFTFVVGAETASLFKDTPGLEHGDAIGQPHDAIHVVLDQKHGCLA